MLTPEEDIEHRFTNHPPSSEGVIERLDEITNMMIELGNVLLQLPIGRERSSAMTKLEECSMWAKAAIARNQ